jgi:hypothetical protein
VNRPAAGLFGWEFVAREFASRVTDFPSDENSPPDDYPAVFGLRFANGEEPIGTDLTLGSKSPSAGPAGF